MSLEGLWFALIALSFAAFVVLDGFDLGAGILHLFVARTQRERTVVLRSIGPVWDGNEVWLLAAGGTVYFAFPPLYADAIAGFYLPVSIVLWLFCFRALGIEMKHQMRHVLWDELWDTAFFGSSLSLTFFLGVALGNIVRGFDLDGNGRFFLPLWTDFGMNDRVGVFDWFTLSVGGTAVVAIAFHGSLWIAHRVDGEASERAKRLAPKLAVATALGLAVTTALLFVVRQDLRAAIGQRPYLALLPIAAAASLAAAALLARKGRHAQAFLGSCAFVGSLVLAAAATIYPYVLPSRSAGEGVLASAAKTSDYSLKMGLVWWNPGMALVVGYFVFLYRRLPRTLHEADEASTPASAVLAGVEVSARSDNEADLEAEEH